MSPEQCSRGSFSPRPALGINRCVPTLRAVPPNTDYFCKGDDYEEKGDLTKGNWNPKRKMWVTTHFSEIIKNVWQFLSIEV